MIGDEVVLRRQIADLSLGGCRFLGPAWESKGTELELVLNFPASRSSLPIEGQVVRASEHDMGVRFHAITDDQKWALRKHIREAQR